MTLNRRLQTGSKGDDMDYKLLFNRNRDSIFYIDRVITDCAGQNYDSALRGYRNLLGSLQSNIEDLLSHPTQIAEIGLTLDPEYVLRILADVAQAQENKDYILLADLLELTIRPLTISIQDALRLVPGVIENDAYLEHNLAALQQQDPALAEALRKAYEGLCRTSGTDRYTAPNGMIYEIEDTQSGYPTLKITGKEGSYYLHSNVNPYREARMFVDVYETEEGEQPTRINLLGAGLLYQAWTIVTHTFYAYPVHVYEPDCNVLVLALSCFNYADWFAKQYLVLHYDPMLKQLSEVLNTDSTGFIIHAPSVRNIAQKEIRSSFEKFFVTDSTWRNQRKVLSVNFYKNCSYLHDPTHAVGAMDEILPVFAGKDIYIVAAGPSLDKNVMLLKKRPHDALIIATGTVYHKLMNLGIRPDYVMMTDANERILGQIYGLEQEEIPLLLLSTACHQFCTRYHGMKYLIFQQDYPQAEALAAVDGYQLFETGGSVSTTALDVAIRGCAASIIFVGLDLAFTDNLAHAAGTSSQIATNQEELLEIPAWDGGTVFTDYKFTIYREWMESRIKKMQTSAGEHAVPIPIINATEGGAYIQGMSCRTLQAIIA
ncbi:MAG: 6-hydroxymethylpterin diphosphokinase MptE-like protein [Lachnospiraceae bacterium]